MNRIVLVSDPTKEFPTNTTSSFKVRLPVPLELKGEGWKVGLASISTPDATLDLTRLSTAVNPRVFMVNAKLMASLAQGVKPVAHRSMATAVQAGARAGAQGQSWRGVARAAGQEIKRGLKRKALPIAATVAKRSAASTAKKGVRNTVGRIRDVLGV